MNFLQPIMFWSALAIAIPVFIHFWHQKKGKKLDWAAMQWLTGVSQQQSRGLRLDDLSLLIVRCLLVLVLVLLMGRPVAGWLKKADHSARIHLVEPSTYLTDNYRFELEEAIKKGEKIYWINAYNEEIKSLSSVSGYPAGGILYLQDLINKISKPGVQFDIYLLNNHKLINQPRIYIPADYTIHTAIDSSENYNHRYLDIGHGKKLFVDKGLLTASDGKSANLPKPASTAVHSGVIHVLAEYKNKAERQTVLAALEALSTVYSLPFEVDDNRNSQKKYDLILTDQSISGVDPGTLYVLSGLAGKQFGMAFPNVRVMQDSLRIQTSEMVNSGQLPEFLGDLLVKHFNLDERNSPLSNQQMNSVFQQSKPVHGNEEGNLRPWFLAIFLLLLILERWMALRKTIQKSYA